jgi:hypothetical protein
VGGSINVAVRFPDGEIIQNECWTNWICPRLKQLQSVTGDVEFLQESLQLEGRGNFYAPIGYGLIVLDLKGGHLFDMQNYSFLNQWYPSSFADEDAPGLSPTDHIDALLERGFIYKVYDQFSGKKIPVPSKVSDLSWEDNISDSRTRSRPVFVIDHDKLGLRYQRLGASKDDLHKLLGWLRKLDFPITPVAQTAWETWIEVADD